MNACRNCGSLAVKDLGFIGAVAPFFLKRVFNMECKFVPSPSPAKRFVQRLVLWPHIALSRIRRNAAFVEIQACTSCSFVQTKHAFADESLSNLYRDYRSQTYNRERIYYEPSYSKIADQVGSGHQEMQARIDTLTAWVRSRVVTNGQFSMLDYGGADGRFLPRLPGERYVYEISEVTPAEGITLIRNESDLGSYSYIQLAHILEHVSRPLEMVRRASQWLAQGGYLYIEVPQDFNKSSIEELVAGSYRGTVPIHEHINLYTVKSVAKLIESAGLQTVDQETAYMDLGWVQATVIRALAKRK
jgi:hypothetical protein